MMKNKYTSGQSLIELIFSFFIMALVIVSIVGLATVSVRNSSFAKNNTQARRYAQEAIEWLRSVRDNQDKWVHFWQKGGNPNSPSPKTYCFPELKESDDHGWTSGHNQDCNEDGEDCSDSIDGGCVFYRTITLTKVDGNNDVVNAVVSVKWQDEKGYHEVSVSSQFTNWQK